MLQNIRQASKGWVAWLIVIAISIPFALWGIERFQTDESGEQKLTSVGDYDVSVYEYSRALSRQRQTLQERYAERYQFVDQEKLKAQVLQRVLGRAVIFASAIDFGLEVGDDQVKKSIFSNEEFITDEQFDGNKYRSFLSINGISAQAYEADIAKNGKYEQYVNSIFNSNFITENEIKNLYQLINHERKFAYLIVNWEDSSSSVKVEDQEISDYYEENKKSYQVAERIKAEYVSVSLESLISNEEPSTESLEDYYRQRETDFANPEIRQAKHILFEATDEKLANEVRLKLMSGEDFSELAKKYSNDPSSKDNGGELGEITRGQMVESFESVAFSLELGEVSEIVETDFGYHIIEVTEIIGGTTPDFNDVQHEVIEAYKQDKAREAFFRLNEELANIAYAQPDSLMPIKDQLELEIKQTEWFGRETGVSSDTITQFPGFREAAFSQQVKSEKLNSTIVEVSDSQIVVLRVLDNQAAYFKPLDEVKELITDLLVKEKSSSNLLQALNEEVKQLNTNKTDWDTLQKKYPGNIYSQKEFQWSSIESLNQETDFQTREVYNYIFDASRVRSLKNKKGFYAASKLENSNVVLFHLVDSRNVNFPKEELKEGETLKIMSRFQQGNDQSSLLEMLQDRYKLSSVDLSNF